LYFIVSSNQQKVLLEHQQLYIMLIKPDIQVKNDFYLTILNTIS